jgi:hypothetical protein
MQSITSILSLAPGFSPVMERRHPARAVSTALSNGRKAAKAAALISFGLITGLKPGANEMSAQATAVDIAIEP